MSLYNTLYGVQELYTPVYISRFFGLFDHISSHPHKPRFEKTNVKKTNTVGGINFLVHFAQGATVAGWLKDSTTIPTTRVLNWGCGLTDGGRVLFIYKTLTWASILYSIDKRRGRNHGYRYWVRANVRSAHGSWIQAFFFWMG